MNPFATPAEVVVYDAPVDMRCGIDSLQRIVAADLGRTPADGTLFVFIGRDRRRLKMLRHDGGAWCMWHVRLDAGRLRWRFGDGGPRESGRIELLRLLADVSRGAPEASGATATRVI